MAAQLKSWKGFTSREINKVLGESGKLWEGDYWDRLIGNAQNFINKVGEIAESEGHHPDLWFGWGYARIKIFTHAIKGLAESDFILAAKIDQISNA